MTWRPRYVVISDVMFPVLMSQPLLYRLIIIWQLHVLLCMPVHMDWNKLRLYMIYIQSVYLYRWVFYICGTCKYAWMSRVFCYYFVWGAVRVTLKICRMSPLTLKSIPFCSYIKAQPGPFRPSDIYDLSGWIYSALSGLYHVEKYQEGVCSQRL